MKVACPVSPGKARARTWAPASRVILVVAPRMIFSAWRATPGLISRVDARRSRRTRSGRRPRGRWSEKPWPERDGAAMFKVPARLGGTGVEKLKSDGRETPVCCTTTLFPERAMVPPLYPGRGFAWMVPLRMVVLARDGHGARCPGRAALRDEIPLGQDHRGRSHLIGLVLRGADAGPHGRGITGDDGVAVSW